MKPKRYAIASAMNGYIVSWDFGVKTMVFANIESALSFIKKEFGEEDETKNTSNTI